MVPPEIRRLLLLWNTALIRSLFVETIKRGYKFRALVNGKWEVGTSLERLFNL